MPGALSALGARSAGEPRRRAVRTRTLRPVGSQQAERVAGARALGSVAIVHDYLNQRGGAERVVLEMAAMWPEAPIYTSLYRPDSTFPEFRDHDVRTSPLDRAARRRRLPQPLPAVPRGLSRLRNAAAGRRDLELERLGSQRAHARRRLARGVLPHAGSLAVRDRASRCLAPPSGAAAGVAADAALGSGGGSPSGPLHRQQQRRRASASGSSTASRRRSSTRPVDVDRFRPSERGRAAARRVAPAALQARRSRRRRGDACRHRPRRRRHGPGARRSAPPAPGRRSAFHGRLATRT